MKPGAPSVVTLAHLVGGLDDGHGLGAVGAGAGGLAGQHVDDPSGCGFPASIFGFNGDDIAGCSCSPWTNWFRLPAIGCYSAERAREIQASPVFAIRARRG